MMLMMQQQMQRLVCNDSIMSVTNRIDDCLLNIRITRFVRRYRIIRNLVNRVINA